VGWEVWRRVDQVWFRWESMKKQRQVELKVGAVGGLFRSGCMLKISEGTGQVVPSG
jgi:hypothetical protein